MSAECFVISASDWDRLMWGFAGMCLLVTILFVFSLVDLDAVERILRYVVRRELRRRRIARIRGDRNGR
ncbi:hypothetical protein I5U88_00735 [Stenotrophomonas maltophilia]|uniref:Transmembrane protein n=1 Tax=Stenotrophomonas maltophilia TaxID=40324 RepID=A0AAD0BTD9_STEMA|nr:hypothetical protein [Stenotrophomonas maltophilia]AUI07618.1 hypothetical protein SmaCSM2_10645 [Stenotrophomonas maltophilia]MBH1680299.1 hypothetical protein [Stenotrophomonas maltophilia]MBH1872668.1 hypothetical protein [Stenotrophomonas maltophilia]